MEPRVRASGEQFSTLLEFMERHGDLCNPRSGPQARLNAERLWRQLATVLNSMGGGVTKSADKWKKVWADWKSKTKKKALLIRRHANGTGDGQSSRQNLTTYEERLLAIIGKPVECHPSIEKQNIEQPAPSAPSPTIGRRLSSSSRSEVRVSPARTTLKARRRRIVTPFDRATSEFVAIEQLRLRQEEKRDRQLHDLESRRIEVEHERNQVLHRFADIAQAVFDHCRSKDNTEGLDYTP